MKRKCYKCKQEKELSDFFRLNKICNECKLEMNKPKTMAFDMPIKQRNPVKKMDLKHSIVRVKTANKRHEKLDCARRVNNVRITLDSEDKYGRTKKDVRPGWDKILEKIKQKIDEL